MRPRHQPPLPSQETASHEGVKDSKVVWVAEHRLLTSGFSGDRCRSSHHCALLRPPQTAVPERHQEPLLSSSQPRLGRLLRHPGAPLIILLFLPPHQVPLLDPDTNMVILSGKGDRYMQFVEVGLAVASWIVALLQVTDSAPWFVPGLRYTGEQTKVSSRLCDHLTPFPGRLSGSQACHERDAGRGVQGSPAGGDLNCAHHLAG